MKVYHVNETLKDYTTTEKDMKRGVSNCPEDSYRTLKDEIAGPDYVEKEGEAKPAKSDPFEHMGEERMEDTIADSDMDDT